MAKRVSREVVQKVVGFDALPATPETRTRAPGRYLVRRDEVYFFQVRLPKALARSARIPPLRIKLGTRPRREAQAMAEGMARAAKGVFETLTMLTRGDAFEAVGPLGFEPGTSPEEFRANMLSFLERASAIVSQRPKVTARDLRNAAMWHDLFALQREIDKGVEGSLLVQTYATTLRQEIMRRWRISQGYNDDGERDFTETAAQPTFANTLPTPASVTVLISTEN
jgi:hypothetical protein